jgi:hypothetical protein
MGVEPIYTALRGAASLPQCVHIIFGNDLVLSWDSSRN